MVHSHDPRPLSHIGWCFDRLDSYRGTIHRSAINRRAERSDLAGELRTEQVMNLTRAIQKHEDMAAMYARQGLSRRARIELLRAEQLKKAQQIKRECKHAAA
jgi:hypothetical protein